MLKKELCITGSLVKTRSVLKDGAGVMEGRSGLAGIPFMSTPGEFFGLNDYVTPNETLEIVVGPKKYQGINCVKVRRQNGVAGFLYWTNLRSSADHI